MHYNNSKSCWISTSERWIIIKTKFFPLGPFRLKCQKSLHVWFIREKWLIQRRGLEYKQIGLKSSAIAFSFAWVFNIFNDHFLSFILASVVPNHKTATKIDVLNKIAGTLKCAPDKIDAGGRGKTGDNDEWDWIF